MNRILLLLLFSLTGIEIANAQIIRIGGGINYSGPTQNPAGATSRIGMGTQFGADIQLINRAFYFQPGIQYCISNTRFSHPSFADQKSNVVVGGLKIPIVVGFRAIKSTYKLDMDKFLVRFYTGPSFMAVTSVKHKNMSDKNYLLTDKEYHDVEWAWQVGTGIDIRFLFVDFGYQRGLTNVFTGPNTAKTSMVYLTLGLKLRRYNKFWGTHTGPEKSDPVEF